jgi:hypothetical protein
VLTLRIRLGSVWLRASHACGDADEEAADPADQLTPGFSIWITPSSAPLSTSIPTGMMYWSSMCPIMAPLPRGDAEGHDVVLDHLVEGERPIAFRLGGIRCSDRG